nr:SymE family type I addiction module toxin [Aliidiomarina quisquiliarum]
MQMRGDWLAAAGFDIQTPVRVRAMPGCLVVTVEQAGQESAEG